MKKIREKTAQILNTILNTEYTSDYYLKINFFELGIDSLLFLRLLVQIENEFEISIEDEDLIEPILTNFETLTTYIYKKIEKKNDYVSQ